MHIKYLLEETQGTKTLGRPRHRWEDNNIMYLKVIGHENVD